MSKSLFYMFLSLPLSFQIKLSITHLAKGVQIRSFFWSVFSCIQENADQKILLIWTLFMQCSAEKHLGKARALNMATTSKWVSTIHIHAKLRMTMRDKVNIKTSSTRKQLPDSTKKKKHQGHVSPPKETLSSYDTSFVDSGPARTVTTCVETYFKIIQELFKASQGKQNVPQICRN